MKTPTLPTLLSALAVVATPLVATPLVATRLVAGAVDAPTPLPTPLPTIADRTQTMTHMPGFLDLYWDEATGRLFLEIDRFGEDLLYQVSLASGLGSNPVGLDRGQLGATRLLRAERVGPRVLLVERNQGFRALSSNPDEVQAVDEAFTPSVFWGFEVAAESDGRVLVDATDFFLRDAHGVLPRVERADGAEYALDPARSVFHLPRTRSFPKNTEVETLLTFTTAKPGPYVRSVAVNAQAVTVRQHHSFVELPNDGYTPRPADPRIGTLDLRFLDYATPIDQPLDVRWALRHRLEKKDPMADRSKPVKPLVYYLDRGVPEPIRSALLEGASWWKEAFEAAGFVDAFRVEMLPEGADPMDLRYNVIHWTHRSTRGWSYGYSVVDPRTGEILKGNVNLGSLRLRQDHLIATGLAPSPAAACSLSATPGFAYLAQATGTDPVAMALARVRQLSAHEVGHTLGFPHNYIASTYDRGSVMDYPAPLVRLANGRLDLSDAYASGIGAYDRHAVNWLYREFPPGTDEAAALDAIIEEGRRQGLRYIDHVDNAFAGAAHEFASVWDNGADLVDELERVLEVRRLGLEAFSAASLPRGAPRGDLEQVLLPLYLHHRYQMAAAAQSLGGADFRYAVVGEADPAVVPVPAAKQRRALELLLRTLDVEFLALPERILELLSPGTPYNDSVGLPRVEPERYRIQPERFPRDTGVLFDPLGAVTVSADLTLQALLHPRRLARLVSRGHGDSPGVAEVADRLLRTTWGTPSPEDGRHAVEVQRTARSVTLARLMEAAADHPMPQVRAVLTDQLLGLADRLEENPQAEPHDRFAAAEIRRWDQRPAPQFSPPRPPAIPPGSPIGGGGSRGW